jgi:hypothetical protein
MATLVALEGGTEPVEVAFSAQELLAAAQGNVTGLILAAARYCKDRSLSFEAWVESMGRLEAPFWEKEAYRSPLGAARRVALWLAAAGARHVAVAGDERRAEVSYRWPDAGWLEALGLSRAEVQAFCRLFAPIAEGLDLWFACALDGDLTRLSFARESGEGPREG